MTASSMENDSAIQASKTIHLSVANTPGYTHAPGLTDESAKHASTLLTLNHTLYHTKWKATFHNHIVHHILALWALGASRDEIQDMWDYNVPYQAPIEPQESADGADPDLKDPVVFAECLGKDAYYAAFLRYFENEVAEKGMPSVIKEYLLKGDERADDILCRMYTDLLHPMIHLGCAIEFKQPSLVAEALAGACIHDNWPKTFLLPTEEYVRSNDKSKTRIPNNDLPDILFKLSNDPVIAYGVKDSDPFNKIPDGFLKRVSAERLVPYLSRWRVIPEEGMLEHSMNEMMRTSAYMLGAAQRPGKREAMDFVTLHCATTFVFYPAILAQDWLSNHDKARLLETQGRVNAVMYAGCGCPELHDDRIDKYVPRHPSDGWPELFHRAIVYRDEGHAAKLIRAMYSLEQLSDLGNSLRLRKEDFFKIAHMGLDSIEKAMEADGNRVPEKAAEDVIKRVGKGSEMVVDNMKRWVFYGGLERAWDHVPRGL